MPRWHAMMWTIWLFHQEQENLLFNSCPGLPFLPLLPSFICLSIPHTCLQRKRLGVTRCKLRIFYSSHFEIWTNLSNLFDLFLKPLLTFQSVLFRFGVDYNLNPMLFTPIEIWTLILQLIDQNSVTITCFFISDFWRCDSDPVVLTSGMLLLLLLWAKTSKQTPRIFL